MIIQRIHIQGFKSLENVIFEPNSGFSCLVGSNGAGKSNFCDALLFFKNVILNGVSNAIEEIGDKSFITDKEETSFLLSVKNTDDDNIHEYFLSINIQNGKIIKEKLSNNIVTAYSREEDKLARLNIDKIQGILDEIANNIKHVEEFQTKNPNDIEPQELEESIEKLNKLINLGNSIISISEKKEIPLLFQDNNSKDLNPDKTALSFYFEDAPIYDFIQKLNVYRINPLSPKLPNKLFNKANLLIHGQNLATILLEIQNNQDKWRDLHELLSLIVPSIDEIEVRKGEFDDSLSLYFKENNKPLPAISISDGTIYTLAILTALLWNEKENTLIIIEEPERGIHPHAINEIISFIKQIVDENFLQVIVTTHSETVVRNCKLDELWLVDKHNGETHLKNAKKANPHLEETSLDQAWLMNLLNGGLPW